MQLSGKSQTSESFIVHGTSDAIMPPPYSALAAPPRVHDSEFIINFKLETEQEEIVGHFLYLKSPIDRTVY